MFIKVFEEQSIEEIEKKVNVYLKSKEVEEYDLHSLLQSESMAEVNGKLERRITMTCIFTDQLYQDFEEDDF